MRTRRGLEICAGAGGSINPTPESDEGNNRLAIVFFNVSRSISSSKSDDSLSKSGELELMFDIEGRPVDPIPIANPMPMPISISIGIDVDVDARRTVNC